MTVWPTPPLKVIVAGGSIAGLCAAIALRGIGCDVEVFERTAGEMTSRGAGIVVRDDLLDLLRRHGAPELPATVCRERRVLAADGGEGGAATPMDLRFTSWYAIYRTLRSAFPVERYHVGSTLTRIDRTAGRVVAQLSGRGDAEADLLVCADGSDAQSRRWLLPDVAPRYAGYVAWRGTVDEDRAPAGLARFFDGAFTLCQARSGGHILCYFIPGSAAATGPGERRLNWVWYVPVPEGRELERLLTDRTGARHGASVPPGMVPAGLAAGLRAAAARELHPRFAELVESTADPFIQTILDVAVPQMAFAHTCLVGDAAFVLRPHLAASTAKAAADASSLAAAIAAAPGDPQAALRAWQGRQLEYGRALLDRAVELGRRSVERRDGRLAPTLRDSVERLRGIPSEGARSE